MNRPFAVCALFLSLVACQTRQQVAHDQEWQAMAGEGHRQRAEHAWSAVVSGAQLLPASPAQAGLEVGNIRLVRSDALDTHGYLDLGQSLGALAGVMTNARPVTLPPYLFTFDVTDGLDPGVPTRALGVAAGLTGMQGGTGTWTLQPAAIRKRRIWRRCRTRWRNGPRPSGGIG